MTDWRRILAVMVAELIVLVFLFDLYLFWRYGKGVIHWIIEKCHRSSKGTVFLKGLHPGGVSLRLVRNCWPIFFKSQPISTLAIRRNRK